MKQVYLLTDYGLGDTSNIQQGQGFLYYPNDPTTPIEEPLKGNFGLIVGAGNGYAYNHSDIDFETLSVVKTEPADGTKFTANIAPPTDVEEDCVYTLLLSKKGAGFNVRNNWTHSVLAKSDDADDVMNELAKLINANGINTGLSAEYASGTLTIEASDYTDWAVNTSDDWMKPEIEIVSQGVTPIGDGAYIKNLLSQCAAGKGINYLAEDGKELYPNYRAMMGMLAEYDGTPVFVIYTLRFAVSRKSAKTRDEVVSQLVHLVVPMSSDDTIAALDTIFGINADTNTAETTEVLADSDGE